jgi:hypothetical protein
MAVSGVTCVLGMGPTAMFYPFGHLTPYAYANTHACLNVYRLTATRATGPLDSSIIFVIIGDDCTVCNLCIQTHEISAQPNARRRLEAHNVSHAV